MKVLVIGAGRMGIRHVEGLSTSEQITEIHIVDINQKSLENAKQVLSGNEMKSKFRYGLLSQLNTKNFDVSIIATTASNRLESCLFASDLGVKYMLIEKPLGQNMNEVNQLIETLSKTDTQCFVNLNMRMYDFIVDLKKDLEEKPQLVGPKVISINTGSIGIGANGIHYLDLIYFLLGADKSELVAGEIDENTIPSGRGSQFEDFGGWCTLKLYKKDKFLGRALLSLSATSTVFGGWEIVGPHGRIILNEIEQKRIDILRKEDSVLPMNRYAADYLSPIERSIHTPILGDLTLKWFNGIIEEKYYLPSISESINTHNLLFDWLSLSERKEFPIT